MKRYVNKHHMFFFFILVAVESMAANFAHPITPTLIQNLQLPDYAFGLLFAGMAFTNFLFSPLWASRIRTLGSRKVLGICCVGYGIGQAMFSMMKTLPTILCARLLSGFFVGGISVGFLTYIIHEGVQKRGQYLALCATFTTVFSAFGYMVGGFVGVYSISLTFALQSLTLMSSGVFFFFCLREDKGEEIRAFAIWKDANPFQAFLDCRHFMTLAFAVLFFVVFLTSTASTAYDQCFNYFLKDQFHLNSSYNGMVKAIVGFISLLANTTICMWILHRTNVNKTIVLVLGCGAAFLFGVALIQDMMWFVVMNFLFFAINAIYVPLLQDLCARHTDTTNDAVMGFYNAMKSLGMIAGALFAGFVYGRGARLAFFWSAVFFVIGALLMLILHRNRVKKSG